MTTSHSNDSPQANATRERILAVAADIIRAQGIRAASIEQVAKGAGVVRQTLYNYYRAKQAMLIEVARVEGLRTLRKTVARIKLDRSAEDVLLDSILALIAAARRDPFLKLLLTEDPTLGDRDAPEITAVVHELMQFYWTPILDEIGVPSSSEERDRAVEWLSFVHFVLGTRQDSRDQHARRLLQQFVIPAFTDASATSRRTKATTVET